VISPLLAEGSKDRKLRGAPIHVLCYLHATIEVGEYRTVKHLAVAQAVGLSRARVSQAIHLLVTEGYIRARSEGGRRVESYMLLNSRAPSNVKVEAA
jgi:DNA-binding transcriptional MocR family regulator